MHISQVQEYSRQLKDKIDGIKQFPKKRDNKTINEILDIISSYSNQAKFWEEFDAQFRELNIEFIHRLAKKHPDLTDTEIRICSFLFMSMTTKDIANITNRSRRTVENLRYRIRNKMKLDRQTSLSSYIHSI